MKKTLLTALLLTCATLIATAQATFNLPYAKQIGMNNGKWETWPAQWEDQAKEYNFVPILTVKKIDGDIFQIDIYFGGSASGIFKENVIYDPTETEKIRAKNNNAKLTAYRYSGSKDYFWTENITLAEMVATPSKWKTTPNSRIFTIQPSLGSATIYTAQASVQPAQKYTTNFNANKTKIKGTWSDWSSWKTSPKNSYFELKIITEGRKYNIKYYENGKLIKDYNITYDDAKTKSTKEHNAKVNCYKIDGTNDNWVYLLNTTMRNIFSNPGKWANENDAIIVFLDDEKTGNYTRIK